MSKTSCDSMSFFNSLWNNNSKIKNDVTPAPIVGKNIVFIYSKNVMFKDVARYIFVGFPMIKNMLQVLAATNSATRYGIGLIFAFLQKKHINGVNVKMMMSFDVNTVNIEAIRYRDINSFSCEPFALFKVAFARYLKNPISSKNTETKVSVINITNILIGLIEVFATNESKTSFAGTSDVAKSMIAPNRATSQYVPKDIRPLIIIYGLKIMQLIMPRHVNAAIIIVAIISFKKGKLAFPYPYSSNDFGDEFLYVVNLIVYGPSSIGSDSYTQDQLSSLSRFS